MKAESKFYLWVTTYSLPLFLFSLRVDTEPTRRYCCWASWWRKFLWMGSTYNVRWS